MYLEINIEQPCHSARGGIDFFENVRRGSIFSSLHDNTYDDADENVHLPNTTARQRIEFAVADDGLTSLWAAFLDRDKLRPLGGQCRRCIDAWLDSRNLAWR